MQLPMPSRFLRFWLVVALAQKRRSNLTGKMLICGGARCVVGQKQKNWRYIDMPPRVVGALATLPHRDGRVFRSSSPTYDKDGNIKLGAPYRTGESEKGNASGQAKRVFATAARLASWPGEWRIWPPKGSMTEKQEWVSRVSLYAERVRLKKS